ncbi:ABC-type multidrug transport system, ATPase and permease component [Frankia casuarinae]|uniref:ABC transporter related n=3 Tax=Frankia TaxID=1854 RepID=Q2JA63_FRACC|nr:MULTISPECIES: ABC transporter ATP-binding protein [Frankia]ABD11829.1 ABC transporter related [Frankia casuarinae]EYT89813.1 ABC-type multidrug transport system, ATPase and permease component [Frankia casuarinae]TFE23957.1 ABC transporter ATP-binding protein [Frankia sp. B2]
MTLGAPGPMMIRGVGGDRPITRQQIRPGTMRRILPYAKPYRWRLVLLLAAGSLEAASIAANPLLLKFLIDDGILKENTRLVVVVASVVAALALLDAFLGIAQRMLSARFGEQIIYDLRTRVFAHVQRQPIAFFTRAQTGSLVSRLNTDVIEAQQAMSQLLTVLVSSALSLVLVIVTMFYLSWVVTIVVLALVPCFMLPARVVGRRLQRYAREGMQLNAEMSTMMNERFNVAGAILVKLYGEPETESRQFEDRAARVRDINVRTAVYGRVFFVAMTMVASLATAAVYGIGGVLVIHDDFQLGTLAAFAVLLNRLYGPINQLSNIQLNVLTALVSFDRVFEVLDLRPLVAERPGAIALPSASSAAPEIEFDEVSFRYPTADEVSLASLESIALPSAERTGSTAMVLDRISFRAPAGKLTALVGHSGAGKSTITHLVSRLYDPIAGTVWIDGHDLRDLTLKSLRDTVGVVTQDAHMFHDTIGRNLAYAKPDATDEEIVRACQGAQIWNLISALPHGLDTVVGDRGYRLSGGEKQRLALARLLLKAPSIVVLDEATAHLDSESEAAVQRALKSALAGRTSLVIAHRLSTIREADQILVIDAGGVREQGSHEDLLAAGGLYAELYFTQFAGQATDSVDDRVGA